MFRRTHINKSPFIRFQHCHVDKDIITNLLIMYKKIRSNDEEINQRGVRNMEYIETISVEECAKRLKKDPSFVRNAVEQGVFPGSCVKNKNGHRNIVIPRKAFEEYMTKWNPNPSVELVQALIEILSKEKSRCGNSDK